MGSTGLSSAATVNHALSSLSERASPSRTSRYSQSVQGSSPSTFDFSKGDRYSDNPNSRDRYLSLRDAGVKDYPSTGLGSIAASSQRRMKEIERYIYYGDDDNPTIDVNDDILGYPSPRSREFGRYNRRDVDDTKRSENDFYENEYSRLPSQRSNVEPDFSNAPERLDQFYSERKARRLPPQRSSSANSDFSDGPRRLGQYDSDYDHDDPEIVDDYDRRPRRDRSDIPRRMDRRSRRAGRRPRRMGRRPRSDQFDNYYDGDNRRPRGLDRDYDSDYDGMGQFDDRDDVFYDRDDQYEPRRRKNRYNAQNRQSESAHTGRQLQTGRRPDFDPEIDPMYDDPYVEQYY